jgi:hypothetical protein
MMKDQRKIFRNEMAYLHRKTLERVGADTKAMAAMMRETLDKAEKELITLKSENKSLICLKAHVTLNRTRCHEDKILVT